MRSAKKVDHGTVKLDKKMSVQIRKATSAQDIVFVPEIVECEDTTMSEIRLDPLRESRVCGAYSETGLDMLRNQSTN